MKLATQIFFGFLIAIAIDLLDSFVNYTLTLRVKTTSGFLNRSEVVIRQSSELNRSILQMQSSFRGYLLTGDSGFLPAYYDDLKAIPAGAGEMRQLVSLPGQMHVLDSILFLHKQWVDYASGLIAARRRDSGGLYAAQKFNSLLRRQMINGSVQEYDRRISLLFQSLNEEEYRQRNRWRQELADSIRRTDSYSVIFSILLILIGLAIAFILVKKISRRIRSLVKLAESISQGDFGQVRDDKRDELTSLSVSLNLMSERLSSNIGELERKNTALDQFAYVISHDLKAPVRGISNVVRWIEEDYGNEISRDVRKYLDFIPERVRRIEGLIDGLLEYARAGRDGTVKAAVDVGQLVRDLVDMIVPKEYILRTGSLPVITT
ncbi:MAG TPA: CHASE3 domain-containing protein, partial [Puia sp.]